MAYRSQPNKTRSVKEFRKGASKTHRRNLSCGRGGYRL